MTACVNCSRALQPAWKYCIFCGTRTGVAAAAPRSRPIPKRTPVPGYAAVSTVQIPIVPPAAPAPLSAAPVEEPVSSIWPETMGERPSLRSALASTEVPAPTPPREDVAPPEGEDEPAEEFDGAAFDAEPEFEATDESEPDAELEPADDFDDLDEELPEPEGHSPSIADLAHEFEPDADADPEAQPETEFEPEADAEPEPDDVVESGDDAEPEQFRPRRRRGGRGGRTSGTLVAEAPAPELDEPELDEIDGQTEADADEAPADRRGSLNTLAILALLIGILACPLAALFGHLALGQLKASGERGLVPAWIAVVLGYLWFGFWIVFGVYLATNG